MVVDDENTIKLGISVLLEKTGKYRVIAACSNGFEALNIIKDKLPDLK